MAAKRKKWIFFLLGKWCFTCANVQHAFSIRTAHLDSKEDKIFEYMDHIM